MNRLARKGITAVFFVLLVILQIRVADAGRDSDRSAGEAEAASVASEDIKSLLKAYIAEQVQNDKGVFRIHDSQVQEALELNFVKLRDPVREVVGKGHVICADFSSRDGGSIYDIDFWVDHDRGAPRVTEAVIHKKDGIVRYNYDNARPVALLN